MGNKQAKAAIDNLQIAACTLHGSDGKTHILNEDLFSATDVALKGYCKRTRSRGYEWISRVDGGVTFHADTMGNGRKAYCYDRSGNFVAYIRCGGIFKEDEERIYRQTPAYPGQAPADLSNDKESEGRTLYHFATIQVTRELRKAEAYYSAVTGNDDDGAPQYLQMYKTEKLPSHKYFAQIFMLQEQKQYGVPVGHSSVPVAKVFDGGMTLKGPKIDIEMSQGCDLAAIILVGQACALFGSTAGAMSGAGIYE